MADIGQHGLTFFSSIITEEYSCWADNFPIGDTSVSDFRVFYQYRHTFKKCHDIYVRLSCFLVNWSFSYISAPSLADKKVISG